MKTENPSCGACFLRRGSAKKIFFTRVGMNVRRGFRWESSGLECNCAIKAANGFAELPSLLNFAQLDYLQADSGWLSFSKTSKDENKMIQVSSVWK